MSHFATKHLPLNRDAVAPDGSDVRRLLGLRGGTMAHFELPPHRTSTAVVHRTVEEIWFFLSGQGEFWRRVGDFTEVVVVHSGVCIAIPVGTQFQFRSLGAAPLAAIGVSMPPWPGDNEATVVAGAWPPTVGGPAGGEYRRSEEYRTSQE